MSAPTIKVEIGLNTTASYDGYFILDDETAGVLDNPTYLLAPSTTFVDVSQWLTGQGTGNRGRSREVDQYQAGMFTFTLRNEDRRFDPSNTASPYSPGIDIRQPVNAYLVDPELGEIQIFGGKVEDIQVNYEKPNICTVTITCLDAFSELANQKITPYTPVSQTTGARILHVLRNLDSPPANRQIDNGNTVLLTADVPNSDALSYCQQCAQAEGGWFYVDRTGVLTFSDRYTVANSIGRYRHIESTWFYEPFFALDPTWGWYGGTVGFTDVPVASFDPGNGVRYSAIVQQSQALLLYNKVTSTPTGSAQISVNDHPSQDAYLTRELNMGTPDTSVSDARDLMRTALRRYREPEIRFGSVTVNLMHETAQANLAALASLDLLDAVPVTRTPPGSGSPAVISKLCTIEGISWNFDVSSSSYSVTYSLGTISQSGPIVLDDPNFGLLDTGSLAF